jgi:hypothetical protein
MGQHNPEKGQHFAPKCERSDFFPPGWVGCRAGLVVCGEGTTSLILLEI